MELSNFLITIQAEISERMQDPDNNYPYRELVFAETIMRHMSEINMTYDDPSVCYYEGKYGNSLLRLAGYSFDSEGEGLDLFVSLYSNSETIQSVPDSETKTAGVQCWRFLESCRKGSLNSFMDPSHDAYPLALQIRETWATLDPIRIYVLTDRVAKSKHFADLQKDGKTVKLEVMDVERLFRHWAEGKPESEIEADFIQLCGLPLPCVYMPASDTDYDCALTMFPGEALRFMYDRYGSRLLEANVRSFLSTTGKINKGIRDTLRECPDRFMAYNNGIVIVTEEILWENLPHGIPAIRGLKGMQIVNGGQTTASLYFTKKKYPDTNIGRVRVPAKILLLNEYGRTAEQELIAAISRYSNSQNVVRQADLSSNKPFHVAMEKLSTTTYCPDGVGRWFYERTTGSYNVMLATQGTTPSKLKNLKNAIPSSRKITKTDLAKYLNAWDRRPHTVSLGSQKNFVEFMKRLDDDLGDLTPRLSAQIYKEIIAKVIFFKAVHKITRKRFSAFQANIAAYTVSVASDMVGPRISLDRIWQNQDISDALRNQCEIWAREVNSVLESTSSGTMISEWAKKEKCWQTVRIRSFRAPSEGIPEFKPFN